MTRREKTLALVLGVAPYAETTLLIRLLTRGQGVVRALAKGARRSAGHAAPQAAFEPLALIETGLHLKNHDALGTLGEVRLVRDWPALRHDLPRFAYAALGVEVLGLLAADSPAESPMLEHALEFLAALETTSAPGSLAIAFLIALLHESGFAPRLAPALDPAALPPTLVWDFEHACFAIPSAATALRSLRLPRAAVAALGSALHDAPALDGSFQVSAVQGPALLRWLARVWEDHLHMQLRSWDFLEKMILAPKP
jgi:DNA repair protein RecO (recombination protein O)